MFSALFSFIAGNAFRLMFGELISFFKARQDHSFEVERMKIQGELDAAQHDRTMAMLAQQATLGIKVIDAQRDADLDRIEGSAWLDAVQSVGKQTGIKFLDIWNGSIRPLLATLAIFAVIRAIAMHGWELTDWDRELIAAILGIYVADRSLQKRGK